MKKIRKIDRPIIYGGYHNYSRYLDYYEVNDYFLVDDERWNKYSEFESYSYTHTEQSKRNFRENSDWMDKDPQVIEMRRLIGMANNSQIWQFNAKLGHGNDYVRHYALFAEKTLREITKFEEKIAYPFLFFWVKIANIKISLYNRFITLNSIDHLKAQKAVEEGKVVTNLAYGARQVLFCMINGKLHINFPFHRDGWKPTEYDTVPDYFGLYRIYKMARY